MTETSTTPPIGPGGRIEEVGLEREMQRSYLDYAMTVIVGRALPDVRDGLKPVHRRVLYAMYDGGFRPDRAYSKCARVVGDVMGNYHPHGDTAIYDTLVRLAQPWTLRYPLIDGQGNFGSPGDDGAAAMRYTECRMAPLAMEMVRDIDEETVDFQPNYDGKGSEPLILPSRFPNLLVNGSSGIAVGMATNIPPHNLREVAEGVRWSLDNPEAAKDELLNALMARIHGPDFPTHATLIGRRGIDDAYRTGRGSVIMRAIVTVEEIRNRTCLVVTELPYQVNPDALMRAFAELANEGRVSGIADLQNDSSARTGMRLVIILKRDASPQVVLNNLYKHSQLQLSFGCNMVALVDGVPRTLSLDVFITAWIRHQLVIITRRTQYRLRKAQERQHILIGYLKALDSLDAVIALIRASETAEDARTGLMSLLEIDEIQANAILDMQLRRLAALERQRIVDEYTDLSTRIAAYEAILADPAQQRQIVRDELDEIVNRYGDERRTVMLPAEGDVDDEDLIAETDIVVTITRDGYAKRTPQEAYRSQHRGGKGIRGATLRQDDVVSHFFTTTTHHWLLFFTNTGRVYRIKGYRLPDVSRDARGTHLANLLQLAGGEVVQQILDLRDYQASPYLVLATRRGQVKKSVLTDYDVNRVGGIIAVHLADDDELVSAALCSAGDDLLLVSRLGQSIRFTADDEALRPMGRDTRGVKGMVFRDGDELLAMEVVTGGDAREDTEGPDLLVATEGGYAKRTPISEYRLQSRAGLGIKTIKANRDRGKLVGALVVSDGDEVLAISVSGTVLRTPVTEVRRAGRDTMGVRLLDLSAGDSVVVVARNPEAVVDSSEPESTDGDTEGLDPATPEPADRAALAVEGDNGEAVAESEGPAHPGQGTDQEDHG